MRYGLIFLFLGFLLSVSVWLFESYSAKTISVYCASNFLVLGVAYLFKFPRIFMKRTDGKIHPVSFAFFLPIHLLNWVSFQLATCSAGYAPRHEIAANLWLGRKPKGHEAAEMKANARWEVIDMTAEFPACEGVRGLRYLCLATLDHTAPTPAQINRAIDFIQQQISRGPILVHCALGHGRSATVVAAWMLYNKLAKTPEEAERKLREIRKGVRLKKSQSQLLTDMYCES